MALTYLMLLMVVLAVRGADNDDQDFSWLEKHLPSPLSYTSLGDVSIVHNTKISYDEFLTEFKGMLH